jgi:hypothetical protein
VRIQGIRLLGGDVQDLLLGFRLRRLDERDDAEPHQEPEGHDKPAEARHGVLLFRGTSEG